MYHSVVVLCCFQLFFFHVTSVMYSPFLNWQKSYYRLCVILRVLDHNHHETEQESENNKCSNECGRI